MTTYIGRSSTRRSDDTMDEDTDDKDDTKRKSRNLSEKKRRDQFNMLINELSSMVSTNSRKMDKSTVLKSTIAFLKNHNDLAVRSRVHEIQEDWKPAFLSNEEFTHLILEALDGFIMVFSSSGRILYASESITSLLGHLPNDLLNMTIYDMVYDEDQSELYNILLNPVTNGLYEDNKDNQVSFVCHCKRGGLDFREVSYERVQFVGYFRTDIELLQVDSNVGNRYSGFSGEADTRLVFVGTGRLQTPQLIREMSIVDSSKNEFTSRHSLEWKFLFLDHRAPPIIGYLPFEVLGTSGYDYYHVDDLEKVVTCHEALMQKGEGTSCYYRFLTKGQQWIWLQTRFYITYHQWNSKPEFIVCTHRVVSYVNVMKQLRKEPETSDPSQDGDMITESVPDSKNTRTSWSAKTPAKNTRCDGKPARSKQSLQTPGSDTPSMSPADSPASRHSQSVRSRSGHIVSSSPVKAPVSNSKSVITSEFIEPPQAASYAVAAIPVQSVITTFPAQPAVVTSLSTSELLRQPLIMTTAQSQLQDQLQRKHEQLQQLIVQQQEELRRVSEQLLMARYGLLPSLINVNQQTPVSLPYTVATSPVTTQLTASTPTSPDVFVPAHSPLTVTGVTRPSVMIEPHHMNLQGHSSEEVIPFQFSQQQAQLLFSSSLGSPNSTQHSQ